MIWRCWRSRSSRSKRRLRGTNRTSADHYLKKNLSRWGHGNLFTEATSNIFSAETIIYLLYIRAASIVCCCVHRYMLVSFTATQLGNGVARREGQRKSPVVGWGGGLNYWASTAREQGNRRRRAERAAVAHGAVLYLEQLADIAGPEDLVHVGELVRLPGREVGREDAAGRAPAPQQLARRARRRGGRSATARLPSSGPGSGHRHHHHHVPHRRGDRQTGEREWE